MTECPRARQPWVEIVLVLGLSLGQSAVYSLLSYWEKMTRPTPIGQQTTSMNSSWTPDRPWLDLSYQLAGIIFPMVPAFLALYLLHLTHGQGRRAIGFDLRRPWRDTWHTLAITAIIGAGGLAIYAAGRALQVSTKVEPANLAAHWWTVPVYLGLAWMNGFLEEVVMIGFLLTRLREKAWGWPAAIAFSAVIRGLYHLYQGPAGLVGNLIMGVCFGAYYAKTKRVLPLVLVHFLIDAFVFVGYPLVASSWTWLQ